MKTNIFYSDKIQLKTLADYYFYNSHKWGLYVKNMKDSEILKARRYLVDKIEPKVAFARCKIIKINKDFLLLEGDFKIKTEIFASVKKHINIKEIIVFVATIGHIHISNDQGILMHFYIDAWANAYLQSLTEGFKGYIEKEAIGRQLYVSDSFGPGHYNISLDNMETIFHMLDTSSINAKLIDQKMIYPNKSLAEFILIAEESFSDVLSPCKICKGDKNCDYCKYYTL